MWHTVNTQVTEILSNSFPPSREGLSPGGQMGGLGGPRQGLAEMMGTGWVPMEQVITSWAQGLFTG